MTKLKIATFKANDGFCYRYRLKYPIKTLESMGLVEWQDLSSHYPKDLVEACYWADVCVFQASSPPMLLQKIQNVIVENKLEKIIVSEYDDNLFDIDISNPVYKGFGLEEVYRELNGKKEYIYKDGVDGFSIQNNKDLMVEMSKAVIMSDLVTVTNKYLKKAMIPLNENVEILPNNLYLPDMPNHNIINRSNPKEVLVVYQGGDSHYVDIMRTIPVLKRLQKRYGKFLKFLFYGSRFETLYEGLNYELTPWIRPELFFDRFSTNLGDIGFIPLEDTSFNKCKSNIKWLEYSYYGMASCVERRTPYKEHIKDGVNGLMFSEQEEMYKNMCRLIDDQLFRKKIATNAKRDVLKGFDIKDHAINWYNAYKRTLLLKSKQYV